VARDPYLRSARLIRDYQVKAIDGDAGHVEGLLVDDSSWVLRCVVVRTRHWRLLPSISVPLEISRRYSTPGRHRRAGRWLHGRLFSILRAGSVFLGGDPRRVALSPTPATREATS